jgi:hypothetical protein
MVKRYQPAIARDTLICLDLFQGDYGRRQRHTATELAIVTAASLANHVIVREGLPVGLLTAARDPLAGVDTRPLDAERPQALAGEGPDRAQEQGLPLTSELASAWGPSDRQASPHQTARVVRFSLPPRTGRGQLMRVLEILARIQSVPENVKLTVAPVDSGALAGSVGATETVGAMSLADLLRRAATSLSWGATITIITGRETQELIDVLFHLRRAGYAVAVVLVQPGLPSRDLEVRSERLRVPIYKVWQESDLESVVGAAGRGGVSVSVARHADNVRPSAAWRQRS